MLPERAQRPRVKASLWQYVIIDNAETQPGLDWHIKGCRREDVRQAVSKTRYHMKAGQEAIGDMCRPECTQARCLCRLDGPHKLRGGYHGIKVQQPRGQGRHLLKMGGEDGAPLVYFRQVKHMWVGYVDGRNRTSQEGAEVEEQHARAQLLTARKTEPNQAVLWMQMQQDAQILVCVDSTSRT